MNKNISDVEETAKAECKGKRLPKFAKVLYVFAAISLVLYICFIISARFADFFNRYISSIYRAVMSALTDWIPFSLAEFLVIMLPLIIVVLVIHASKNYSDTWHDVWVYCGTVISLLGLFFTLFTVGFAPAYKGS